MTRGRSTAPTDSSQRRLACAVEIELLTGRVRVGVTDMRLSPREFELLVFLVMASLPVSRETIANAIWPNLETKRSLNVVKVTLSRLRARLGNAECIASTPTGYCFAAIAALDIDVLLQQIKAPENVSWPSLVTEVRACRNRIARWSWAQTLRARLALVETLLEAPQDAELPGAL